jgi:N-acetylglucosaminyl-diphospho-decaprenol L-rhamnosyltransferase
MPETPEMEFANETSCPPRACTLRASVAADRERPWQALRAAVVIVNYNTAGLVTDCLRSLAGEAEELGLRVVVVDNASPDGSAERLRGAIEENGWGEWVELIAAGRNGGFAAGNNVALRLLLASESRPDCVLLLNPDTVVRPGAVRQLIAFLERHPRVGIAGSRLENPDGTPQRSAFRFPRVLGEFENGVRFGLVSRLLSRFVVAPPSRDAEHEAEWLSGASLLVRREVFEQIGLLDEGYFLYYEEVDFCRRSRAAGWECWYVPQSRVVHLIGQATGMDTPGPKTRRVPDYWLAARRRYFVKHHGRFVAWLASLAWVIGRASWRVRRRIQRKTDPDPPRLLADFARYNLLTRHPSPSPEVIR